MRTELRGENRELQQRLGILTIIVMAHDQEEALTVANRIICMLQGRIVQTGELDALCHGPANRFVADFMGVSNLFEQDTVRAHAEPLMNGHAPGNGFIACIRPEDVGLVAGETRARVPRTQVLGNLSRLHLDWPGDSLIAEQLGRTALQPGDAIGVDLAPSRCAWVTPQQRWQSQRCAGASTSTVPIAQSAAFTQQLGLELRQIETRQSTSHVQSADSR